MAAKLSSAFSEEDLKSLAETDVGLRLMFDEKEVKTSAIIRLQWCLAKSLFDFFKDNLVKDPSILVVVKKPSGTEVRHFFRVGDQQGIVEFHAPGVHTLSATLVWGERYRDMQKVCLTKSYLGYTDVHSLPSQGLKTFGNAELSINVPKEFFAPQLSEYEAWWVDFWFSTSARDSCAIRRRRILAYSIQPPVLGTWILMKMLLRFTIAFVMGFLFARRVKWSSIVHPFLNTYKDVWEDLLWSERKSWLFYRADGRERTGSVFMWAFMPSVHVAMTAVSLLIMAMAEWPFVWSNFFLMYFIVAAVVTALAGAIALLCFTSDVVLPLVEGAFGYLGELFDRLLDRSGPDAVERMYCSEAPLQGLRPVGRTPRLIYQNFKAQYCKPTPES